MIGSSAILEACLIGIVFVTLMMLVFRNNWTLQYRRRVLQDERYTYQERCERWLRLPPYAVMVHQVWKWDYETDMADEK